jgi:PAS domain S-box-containing protein
VPPKTLTDLAGLRVSAEDLLSAVSATAAQPIWVVDPDDVIGFVNPAAITALGYDTADDLLGRHRHETIHHKRPDGTRYPAAECPMQLPRTAGQTVARDLDWFFRRDGSRFPVSYVSVPIEMADGRGAVVLFADIGDRLREEQVLRERDAVRGSRANSVQRIAALAAGIVGLPLVVVWRYARDGKMATVLGASGDGPDPFQRPRGDGAPARLPGPGDERPHARREPRRLPCARPPERRGDRPRHPRHPPDDIRLHVCWGNYEGPHHRDVALRDIIDVVIEARPAGISFEAANPRHEHEWTVFEDVKLPDGKVVIPGVLDSTTNFIEHPELVAQRLVRYGKLVGPENLMAGTDCGFATFASYLTVDPAITWAKLHAMAEGAALASKELY